MLFSSVITGRPRIRVRRIQGERSKANSNGWSSGRRASRLQLIGSAARASPSPSHLGAPGKHHAGLRLLAITDEMCAPSFIGLRRLVPRHVLLTICVYLCIASTLASSASPKKTGKKRRVQVATAHRCARRDYQTPPPYILLSLGSKLLSRASFKLKGCVKLLPKEEMRNAVPE